MTMRQIHNDMLKYVKTTGITIDKVDYNRSACYVAIKDTDFILQGDNYDTFEVEVDAFYNCHTHIFDDCTLLALYKFIDAMNYKK